MRVSPLNLSLNLSLSLSLNLSLSPLKDRTTHKFSFDEDLFSERQLEILKNLVKEFKDSSGKDLIEETHKENCLWRKVYKADPSGNAQIPLIKVIDEEDDLEIKSSLISRFKEYRKEYRICDS